MSVFGIKPQFDGLIVVAASPYDPAAPYQLGGTDAEIDGTLIVLVDRGVEVIQHNGSESQIKSEPVSCFRWVIKSPYANPRIMLRPAGIITVAQKPLLRPALN